MTLDIDNLPTDPEALRALRNDRCLGVQPAEWPLRIDHPLDLAQRRQIRLEGSGIIEVGVDAEKT